MNISDKPKQQTAFHSLTPDRIITLVEKGLDRRLTNLCRPLISYINRVYELEAEDGSGLVAKFYRPGRWSLDGLQDEHDFLLELAGQEIPVVAPLLLRDGKSLGSYENICFTVFPKMGGRSYDEYNDDQWLELGRLLGRTHNIGAMHLPKDRLTMAPDKSTRQQVDYILKGSFMPDDMLGRFKDLTDTLIAEISPMFSNREMIRIQGDCHFSNLIYRPGESFYIIDFDDMVVGPPVQDFWMLLPGYREESLAEIEMFLEGYEMFRDFDMGSLRLIEPLRAMRYIHYTAWCAHQFAEDGETRVNENFGSRQYWQTEMDDLEDQLKKILNS
ncbi:MAG: serine/threonine protein kinase [Desulfobulbaceae bacterium]|nr:serine/threonine protein kinase [Desulfobulbaceae bacterium]